MKVIDFYIKELGLEKRPAGEALVKRLENNKIFLDANSAVLSGKVLDRDIYLVPAKNLLYQGPLALAMMKEGDIVLFDVDTLLSESDQLEFMKEVLFHEVMHLKRGPMTPELDEIKTPEDLGRLYYLEETIINVQVAPLILKAYNRYLKQQPEQAKRELIKGGLMTLYANEKYKEHIKKVLRGTEYELLLPR